VSMKKGKESNAKMGGTGDIMLRGAMGGGLTMDMYVERPRASLYNVIKKL